VDAGREAQEQTGDGGDAENSAGATCEGGDAPVGEEESELLQREPHECEIEDADSIRSGHHAHRVDDDRGRHEKHERAQWCTLVGDGEHRQQRLAEQEDAQEPQRLREAVPRDADEIDGHAGDQQGGEGEADRGDRAHRRQEQPVDASRHERGRGATASP